MPRDKITSASSRLVCVLVSIACGVASSFAADKMPSPPVPVAGASLSWEQAVRTAVEKQPLLKVAEHEALESQAVGKQIESVNYPQITGFYSHSGGNTRGLAHLGISGSLPKPPNYLTTPRLPARFPSTD